MRHLLCAALVAAAPAVLQPQEGTVPVPGNVAVDGVPAIPQAIAGAVAKYANFRFANLIDWAPADRRMLVWAATDKGSTFQLIDGPGRAAAPLAPFPRGTRQVAAFNPVDPNTLVFVQDTSEGKELLQLVRYDIKTGEMKQITDGNSRNQWPVWSPDGKWLAYHSNRRSAADFDLHVVQPSDPATDRVVLQANGIWRVMAWSPDAKSLLVYEDSGSSQSRLWRVNAASGEKKLLTAENGARWNAPRFTPDGKSVYAVGGDKDADVPGLWRFNVLKGTWTRVSRPGAFVEDFDISSDGKLAAIAYQRDASSVLEVVELPSMKTRPVPSLPPGSILNVAWRPHSHEVGITFRSVAMFGDVFSLEVGAAAPTRWTQSSTGTFDAATLPAPEIIRWKSFDGQTISGILYRPAAKFQGPRPVIINIHGGPVNQERPRFLGRGYYFLNEDGVALIYPNVRGSSGFGKTFERLDDGLKREDAVKDIGALLDWIATQPSLDKDRVMLTGASYGGYLTLAAAEAYNDRIRCAFPAAAITNFVTFMENTAPIRLEDRRAEYGDERDPQMREFLTRISPITNVAKITKPIALAQAGHDTRVPVEQGEQMVKALRANNVPVWYALYKDEGHDGFPSTNAVNNFNQYVWVLFVEKYLLSPAP